MWKHLNDQFEELFCAGHYEAALEKAECALRYALDEFEVLDPHTATSMNNLAVVLRMLDQLDAAEQLVRKALQINVELYGMEHAETGNCLNNLAIIHSDRGDFEVAESLYRWAIEIREQALGKDHPGLEVNYANIEKMQEARREVSKLCGCSL